MEYEYNFYILSSIIILLCMSWSLSHWQNKINPIETYIDVIDATTNVDNASITYLKNEQVYDFISPYLFSENIATAAKIVSQFSINNIHEIVRLIIQSNALSNENIIALICAVALHQETKKERFSLFSLFETYPYLYNKTPLLYTIAQTPYHTIISEIILWITQQKQLHQTMLFDAYAYTINQNNIPTFKILLEQGATISSLQANDLLIKVIEEKKDPLFIQLLVQNLYADPNYSPDNKKTALMFAVSYNNPEQVKALLSLGADKDKMLDESIGTALQIAIITNSTAAELILRRFGARE